MRLNFLADVCKNSTRWPTTEHESSIFKSFRMLATAAVYSAITCNS